MTENLSGFTDEEKAEMRERITRLQADYDASQTELWELQEKVLKLKARSDSLYKNITNSEEDLNTIEGQDTKCRGDHTYVTDVSGRGIGFDTRCKKCGHFKNRYPVY